MSTKFKWQTKAKRSAGKVFIRRWAGLLTRAMVGLTCSGAMLAHAALPDEIQVYTDDINAPGEKGMEIHINTTPRGVKEGTYPGETVNHLGLRVTPEISLGLTPTTDIGLYLPMVKSHDGKAELAGIKFRFKWLPIQAQENNGFFAGLNFEMGQLKQRYSQSPRSFETRTILGWKNSQWLLAINPTFGWDISSGYTHHSPDSSVGTKVARKVSESVALGVEYYNGRGRMNDQLPGALQEKTTYVVMDYEGKPFNFNFGVGKGRTDVTDAWTIKGIIEAPF
jgi:hypothetical protein